ncbi:16S rRNA (guanine(966)-N(2))-methyltransferase RsmD [Candidatus Soleaferrea massiliensis]|uniref:16S rRNA (guanine(966)-N(2))-methyltransferase RsmD n=1 Tax=Candidatus Soleaferrea massiliensis TaxID=1470354 RepID=UPI000590846D|nr:16S rRNA (guanine(966)-N(2))-methyltransferase RsmD [Candidatus Soleaferrea massiliensis]
MRVITGSARGRKLTAPQGLSTRPTADMIKEAIFNSIQFETEQARVLDLFAGSGQLGIEALSRGAAFCIFVDSSRECQNIIKQNVAATGLAQKARIAAMDAFAFLQSTNEQFDIVLLDPPYEQGLVVKALPLVAQKMNDGGVIFCETDRREDLPETAGDFVKFRERRHGKIKLTSYRKGEVL